MKPLKTPNKAKPNDTLYDYVTPGNEFFVIRGTKYKHLGYTKTIFEKESTNILEQWHCVQLPDFPEDSFWVCEQKEGQFNEVFQKR